MKSHNSKRDLKPMSNINQIRIVLCETSHPGNIGATARAMKNMGLHRLCLVNPLKFPNAVATERAAGADDILRDTQVFTTLNEAIADCELVIGTSARTREIAWPVISAKECAEKVFRYPDLSKVAIVFGTERSGLTNEALALCHYHLIIPANPAYESLNLSQAVQIVCYELYQKFLSICLENKENPSNPELSDDDNEQEGRLANLDETMGVFEHLEEVMHAIGFIEPKPTRILTMRLKRFLLKSRLEIEEVHILRGIFKAILQKV